MARMFRERASIKSSEIVALFVLSFFGSMFLFLTLAMIKTILDYLFPPR